MLSIIIRRVYPDTAIIRQYRGISYEYLFKRYSNNIPDKKVTDTSSPITVSFEVHQHIIDRYPEDGYVYSVFCSHNGVGYPVESRYNVDANIMTISSDKFSSYALGVKPEQAEPVEYTITADSHITAINSAEECETVTVSVENCYMTIVTNTSGTVIADITGTDTFTMPAADER